jgi:ubiquinone/menaquinone biosynthesis C-methylase UbiE
VNFDALAADYDRLRTAGGRWLELSELTLEALAGSTRLLDVGCGTGRFAVLAAARLGARVWGVDPSAAMLERARAQPGARTVGWKRAAAERLPFRDGWFDGAHAHLVLHVVDDRPRALAELARVLAPGGRLAVVTFELEHFDRFFLNPYFPSIPAIDRARFPAPAGLLDELAGAGFADLVRRRVSVPVTSTAADVLERVRGRYISTLHLIPDAEYRAGLARLEADVAAGATDFAYSLEWCLLSGRRG